MIQQIEMMGVPIHLYGLILGLALVVGGSISGRVIRIAKSRGEKVLFEEDVVWRGMWWALVGGVIGARLYHVIDQWRYYSQEMWRIGAVWQGGLGIFGGIVGGAIGIYFFAKKNKLDLLQLLDAAVVGLALGQAIGRWGNYVNQELYGKPTQMWWGIFIEKANRLPLYVEYERFHPLFLYESILMFVVFLLLWWGFIKQKLRVGSGELVACYLIGYGLVRGLLDMMRLETWTFHGVAVAQLFSIAAIILGVIWWYKKKGKI
jgi:phosphatidylglycerol:prolipoprotein diacylglycerol transferase